MIKTLKLGLILGLYAAASCLCLAIVNHFTSPVINEIALQKEKEGLKIVFPSASEYISVEKTEIDNAITESKVNLGSIKIESIYEAVDSEDKTLGYIAKITGPSYETTSLLLGLDNEQKITGLHILSTSDSPGYGQKALDPNFQTSRGNTFYGQFKGLSPLVSFNAGSDYEIISGATITTDGITSMITVGTKVIKAYSNSHNLKN